MAGHKRHPAEVTSDRLGDHYGRWHERLSGEELDAISLVRFALQRIADEDEAARSGGKRAPMTTQAGHDHSWAEDVDEVRACCPDFNPGLAGTGIRCPGDHGHAAGGAGSDVDFRYCPLCRIAGNDDSRMGAERVFNVEGAPPEGLLADVCENGHVFPIKNEED
jgi:hypothetical protein